MTFAVALSNTALPAAALYFFFALRAKKKYNKKEKYRCE
jgi:hypothetical protein